tara:strand:+ start:239 stop:508 length:270 start_codon:yes stop_codon:yes gene_type:complete
MSFYSWIFGGEDTESIQPVITIEQMVSSHLEKKTELEQVESKLLKLKADLETLGLAINNRLDSEKNRITSVNSDGPLIITQKTTQPMFY